MEKWNKEGYLIKLVTSGVHWSFMPPTGTRWKLVGKKHFQELKYSLVEAYFQGLVIPWRFIVIPWSFKHIFMAHSWLGKLSSAARISRPVTTCRGISLEVWWQSVKVAPAERLQILRLLGFSASLLSFQRPLPISRETKGRKEGSQGEKVHSHHFSNVAILKIKIREDSQDEGRGRVISKGGQHVWKHCKIISHGAGVYCFFRTQI